jgi:N utilization substance protein A
VGLLMSKETLILVDVLAKEKDLDKETVIGVVEAGLATATKRRIGNEQLDIRVSLNRQSGDYETFRRWLVVEGEPEQADLQLSLAEASKRQAGIKPGDTIEEPIDSIEFGRIEAQIVKQVILQKVREAKRYNIAKSYQEKIGQLIIGSIKRITREQALVDLGDNAEALLLREEMIPREAFRVGDRIRAYLYDVHLEAKGTQIFVSRAKPEMLIELFKIEVPEIAEEVIEIKGAARDPGLRAKLAVKTNDKRIDPIGACIGMRGSRVQAVSSELAEERVDIVLWDDNPAQYVINAMAPAEVASIVVDEDNHSMDIAVEEQQLSQAIGRNGQNIRLASTLTGWTLNVMSVGEAEEKHKTETANLQKVFVDQLGVDEEIADILAQEGFTTVEEIAYVPMQELLDIEDFDEQIVQELRIRAQDALLMKAIATEETLSGAKPADDLLTMEGMTEHLAKVLASNNIITRDDLAELSVDELVAIKDTEVNEKKAAQLIMTARAPWFENTD